MTLFVPLFFVFAVCEPHPTFFLCAHYSSLCPRTSVSGRWPWTRFPRGSTCIRRRSRGWTIFSRPHPVDAARLFLRRQRKRSSSSWRSRFVFERRSGVTWHERVQNLTLNSKRGEFLLFQGHENCFFNLELMTVHKETETFTTLLVKSHTLQCKIQSIVLKINSQNYIFHGLKNS